MTGIADCCARAASGQAAAEAVIALMKSRRRTRPSSERLRTTPVLKAYQIRLAMSALGHKRTYAVQKGMSALPPIATMKADIRKRSCLLYPQKRTWATHKLMSALGQ